jgi:hypothetical protein
MAWSLRKGKGSVYMQHEHTGHSLGAELFVCEVIDGKAIFRFSIRAISSHQRADEDYLHERKLVSAKVDDKTVIEGLDQHLSSFDTWELQIISRGKTLSFAVVPEYERINNYESLTLAVIN